MKDKKVNGIIIENDKRNKEIVKVSIIGIIANVFLSSFPPFLLIFVSINNNSCIILNIC